MTMSFETPDAAIIREIEPGDQIAFSFRKSAGGYILTAVRLAQP